MRKILILITTLVSASYFLNAQNSYTINTVGNAFSPASLTINVGDTVTWTNTGLGFHNVNGLLSTFQNNPQGFTNGISSSSLWTFDYVFTLPGTYQYQCDPHAPGMSGIITVNCDPYDLATNNVNATGATLSWNTIGPTSFLVKYRLLGTTNWNTSTNGVLSTTVSTNSAQLSSLNSSTTYEWRIKPSGCTTSTTWFDGPNFTTTSSCIKTITQTVTNFSPDPLTGYMQFSYDTLIIANTSSCDINIRPEFIISHPTSSISIGMMEIEWFNPYNGLNGSWVTIPYLINGNGDAYGFWNTVSNDPTGFNLATGTTTQEMRIRVRLMNANNSPPNGAHYGTYTAIWETFEVDNTGNTIQSLAPSSSVSLSLVNCSTFSVDNISSSNTSCVGGTDGSASVLSILNGSGSYSYSWTNVAGIIIGSASTVPLSAGTYSCIVSDNNWACTDSVGFIINDSSFTPSVVMTGVDVSCGGVNDGSASAIISAGGGGGNVSTLTYCPSSPFLDQNCNIELVRLFGDGNSINNSTAGFADTYEDYTSSQFTTLTPNQTYNIDISMGVYNSSNAWSAGAKAFIDWNIDGDFDDPGEEIGVIPTMVTSNPNLTTLTFLVPNNGIYGATRLRVVSQYNTDAFGPCEDAGSPTFTPYYGATEDYSIVINGSTPATYLWSTSASDTTDMIDSLILGTYTCTVTDTNGCSAVGSVIIGTQPYSLALSLISPDLNGYNVSCYNGTDGVITTNASGGTGPYTYDWNNNDSTNLSIGSYSVTITDLTGCSVTESIVLTEPDSLSSSFTTTNVSCYGSNNGGAIVNFSGGATGTITGDINYILGWAGTTSPLYFPTTTFNTATLPNPYNSVPAGIYPYTVTDLNGCIIIDTITITQPNSLHSNLIVSDYSGYNISCNGFSNGSIDIQAGGGTAPFTYYFNGSLITNTSISGLSAGNYTDSIIDANNCVFTETITLTEPSSTISANLTSTNISCNGLNNGSITINSNGGTGSHMYSNGGSFLSSSVFTGLAAGLYTVIAKDANNCTITDYATISEPTAIVINLDSSINITVYAVNDGALFTSSSGGGGSLTYLWSGPNGYTSTDEDIDSLVAGTYYLTATTNNTCSSTDTFYVTLPSLLTAHLDSVINLSCNGVCNGKLYITPDGGSPGNTYLWTGPNGYTSTNEDIDQLCAGTYTLEISDAINTATLYFTVSEATPLNIVFDADTAICYNGNAQANAYVYGGTYPYQTLWSNGSVNTTTTLPAGIIHFVRITDANGCITTDSVIVQQPDSISINSTVINISCYGLQNAEVTLNVTNGGTPPFQYSKDNGVNYQAGNTFYAVAEGAAYYLITDGNGCSNNIAVTVNEPAELVSIINATHATCHEDCDGTASTAVFGGTSPYSFDWGGANPNNLCAGFYNLIITDANGCVEANSTIITEPNPVIVNISQNGNTIEATTGFISYQWYDGFGNSINGAINDTFTPTIQGEYSVKATDANGCSAISEKILVIIEIINHVNQHDIKLTVYPNPTKGKLIIESSEYLTSISVLNSLGNQLIFIDNNITFEQQTNIDLSALKRGVYFIEIEINNQLINHKIILQ